MTTKKTLTNEIISFCLIGFVIFASKSIFFGNFTVPTPSMVPTIQVGDKLVANLVLYNLRVPFTKKIIFNFSKPQRGEIIVFDAPKEPNISYVKRLVAVPGDTIEVKNGFITINGQPLKTSLADEEAIEEILVNGGTYQETNLQGLSYTVRRVSGGVNYVNRVREGFNTKEPRIHDIKRTLDEDEYFAMGDNRDDSSDSRDWGIIPFENIRGQAKFVYYSSYHPDYLNTWFFIPPHSIRWERFFHKLS